MTMMTMRMMTRIRKMGATVMLSFYSVIYFFCFRLCACIPKSASCGKAFVLSMEFCLSCSRIIFLSCSVVLWRWCCQIAVKFSIFCSFDWPGTMFICYLLLSWMLGLGWFVVV